MSPLYRAKGHCGLLLALKLSLLAAARTVTAIVPAAAEELR